MRDSADDGSLCHSGFKQAVGELENKFDYFRVRVQMPGQSSELDRP